MGIKRAGGWQLGEDGWELITEPDADLAAGSVDEVLERVGEDAELAGQVLAAENAKSKPRKTLVAALEELLEAQEEQE
jgi:hypothetical protein